jgi:molecular chaperone HscB
MADLTPFALLGLPERFALSEELVQKGWMNAIARVHPDRFAGRPAAERRVAEQWAGRINEARDELTDPVRRASALLRLRGADTGSETDTRMDGAFLMQQMLWREEAESLRASGASLEPLLARIGDERGRLIAALEESLDASPDTTRAREAVRRLMFVEKIRRDILRGAQQ